MTRENRLRVVLVVGISLWLMVSASLAVEPGKVSWTAQVICSYRAIGAQHPDPKLRNPDYLAEKFVSDAYWETALLPKDYETARMTMRMVGGGASYYYVNARTHHIDALLKQMADTGATQVIILGAGFDSRGYRFRQAYPRLRFFEVDLPATIESKKEKVIQIFGRLPETVVYAPSISIPRHWKTCWTSWDTIPNRRAFSSGRGSPCTSPRTPAAAPCLL